MFKLIYVSMDAARSETFRELRRGATLEQVLPCLEFISKLRSQGEVEEFGLLFVVQERNFEEMKDFVSLAKSLRCDTVKFHRIMDFGTYPPGEFERRDVCARQHPRHKELLELLADSVFDDPIVDLGNLFDLFKQVHMDQAASR